MKDDPHNEIKSIHPKACIYILIHFLKKIYYKYAIFNNDFNILLVCIEINPLTHRLSWPNLSGGPAEKCGQLKVKDEIIEVNGVSFDGMRHYEAWNHLKFLDDGEVKLKIRRL